MGTVVQLVCPHCGNNAVHDINGSHGGYTTVCKACRKAFKVWLQYGRVTKTSK